MRDEIIKKNLIITISSLLLFFLFSFFATSYSIRNTFENEVVSFSQMVENQLENENNNDIEVIKCSMGGEKCRRKDSALASHGTDNGQSHASRAFSHAGDILHRYYSFHNVP